MIALVIPAAPEHPMRYVRVDGDELKGLQRLVGGYIEAVPLPSFLKCANTVTSYVNEDGKFDPSCVPNMRATDYMVPGFGLLYGDYIGGTFVVCGFSPARGSHLPKPPREAIDRARLIEREATGRTLPYIDDADVVSVDDVVAEWEATATD